MALKTSIREFPGLSHHAFQHPLDSQALAGLERVPLLPQIVAKLSEAVTERFVRVQQISSSLRVSSRQYPSLHKQYVQMAQVLDVRKLPELFIQTTPLINAYAIGIESYFIVVTTGLIDLMTEDELLAIVGHELGHVKCEHMKYVTTANMLTLFGAAILEHYLPPLVGPLTNVGIQLALLEWYRKAEFSCDRAALLTTQNQDAVFTALAKLAGFSKHLGDTFNIEEVKRQAEDYEDIGAGGLLDRIIQVYVLLGQTHPYPVVRVNEISKWANSNEYSQILNGQYQLIAAAPATVSQLPPLPLETPTGLRCPRCLKDWPAGTAFCPNDNMNLRGAKVVCGKCHVVVEPNWFHCLNCGNQLGKGPS